MYETLAYVSGKHTFGKQNYQKPGVEAESNFRVIRVLPLYLPNNDMGIEALRFCPSHPLCSVMLCGLFCFVFSYLCSIVWSFGKTSASTATKHYHSRTVFRETSHPGKWPSGNRLSRKRLYVKKPSWKVNIQETTVHRMKSVSTRRQIESNVLQMQSVVHVRSGRLCSIKHRKMSFYSTRYFLNAFMRMPSRNGNSVHLKFSVLYQIEHWVCYSPTISGKRWKCVLKCVKIWTRQLQWQRIGNAVTINLVYSEWRQPKTS